jgi:hypothetical protein
MTRVNGWGASSDATLDAENQVRYSKESRPFVVSKNGTLLPEVREVLALIAKTS